MWRRCGDFFHTELMVKCGKLAHIAQEAIRRSGKDIPLERVNIGIKGEILEQA